MSQFSPSGDKATLKDFIADKPGFYPAGRLDYDSEGLLILTDDGKLQHHISHPKYKAPKHYWVQVEGAPADSDLQQLRQGITLKDGPTRPATAKLIDEPPGLWKRVPPIRERQSIPTQWLEIVISEGRNRQVRRMTAAIGFPTLRLIRHRVGDWSIQDIPLGHFSEQTIQVNNETTTRGSSQSPSGNRRTSKRSNPRKKSNQRRK